jgi:hypothetical protein
MPILGNNVIRCIYGLSVSPDSVSFCIFTQHLSKTRMSADFEDEDAPPELIDVSAMPADQTSVDEEPTTRVPITLVTGMMKECILV